MGNGILWLDSDFSFDEFMNQETFIPRPVYQYQYQ